MKNQKILVIVLFMLLGINSFAQRKADAVIPFDQNIETILLNPLTGEIIVKEKSKISSYNPENGKISWVVDEAEIGKTSVVASATKVSNALSNGDLTKFFESDESLEFIPNSPFIEGVINAKDIIINSTTGKIVFNSGEKNYRVVNSEFLQETGDFLFIATDGANFNTILYDLDSGKEIWTTKLGSLEGVLKQLSGFIPFKNNTSKDQLNITDKYIYTSINGSLYKLERTSGKILWSTPFKLNMFYLSQSEKDVIIIKNSGNILSMKQAINVLNTETGEPIWNEDIKTKYISYIEDWSDRILIAHSSGFNFFNYSDGKKIWKKDAKGDDIKQVIPIDKDYLYIADKEMNLIDKNGKNLWKKTIEISDNSEDPVYYLGKVDNNRVFYLTATYGNMVDYTTGKKIWKKNIEFEKDRPLLYDFDETTKSCLVYNDKKIFKFDPNALEKPEPVAKLKEIKEDKNMAGLDLFDWGICLTGQCDVLGVTLDGVTKYHNMYKEPGGGKRKFLKVGGGITFGAVGAVGSLATAAVTITSRDANGNVVSESSGALFGKNAQMAGYAAVGAATIGSSLLPMVKERFNALKQNSTYAFVFTKGEKGENPVLVKVRKTDGAEIDKIEIDNTKPIYEVDPVTDNVFYAFKKELRIFTKK